jgi:diguanylate cyclase (GGDEF)-like protein
MINREQEQARLIAESMGANGSAGRDLAWIVAVGVLLTAVAVLTPLTERGYDALEWLDNKDMAGLLALAFIVPAGAILFAVRRYQDTSRVRDALEKLASRDSLTGLPNRQFLGAGFDDLLTNARRTHGRVAVLFIDLTGFKAINETYGHEVGDQLMVAVADRLSEAMGDTDVVVRYGGDEFVAFCPEATNAMAAERLAKRFLRVIETPFERGDEVIRLSASVGIAITEERCTRPDDVLRDADAALYQAKQRGGGSYALFDRSMRDSITPSTAERRLREALDDGEFKLYYQPIVSLWTRRLVGVEAQLRWDDPGRGMIDADAFAAALEDTGLIVPVGNWVLDEVCRQTRVWQDEFPDRPPLNVKVSISPRQLAQTDFIPTVRHALQSTGASADRLCLELTEGALMHDVTTTWTTLREAKALGVTLALDEFGTGLSSLTYLRRFSLDLLNLDKVFIDGLGNSREDETILEHVIGMAKALGIVTVAMGVDTEKQVEHLRSFNCDLAQGEYFSPPQPPAIIDDLLARGGDDEEWRPVEAPPRAGAGEAAVVEIPRFRSATVTARADEPT